jgi:hypothetical protein
MLNTGSGLQLAAREVVAALIVADWARFSNESDGRFYYVIRETDRQRHD